MYHYIHELRVSLCTFYVRDKVFQRHRVNVRSKEVENGMFLVACIGLRADCFHTCCC